MFIEGKVVDNGVVLGNHIAERRENSKVWPDEFVDEVIELTVKFLFFIFLSEDAQLYFAKNSFFKKDVDKDVIAFVIQSIFNLHYF